MVLNTQISHVEITKICKKCCRKLCTCRTTITHSELDDTPQCVSHQESIKPDTDQGSSLATRIPASTGSFSLFKYFEILLLKVGNLWLKYFSSFHSDVDKWNSIEILLSQEVLRTDLMAVRRGEAPWKHQTVPLSPDARWNWFLPPAQGPERQQPSFLMTLASKNSFNDEEIHSLLLCSWKQWFHFCGGLPGK